MNVKSEILCIFIFMAEFFISPSALARQIDQMIDSSAHEDTKLETFDKTTELFFKTNLLFS